MLEKPDIQDEIIISHAQNAYDLHITKLSFLPIGADSGTSLYRIVTENSAYFLKLRKGFDGITVIVPLFLKEQGIHAIIAPIETRSQRHWADFGDYTMILYPFIEGKDGFSRELSDGHRRSLAAALKGIHTTQVPPELKSLIPQENFSPHWRASLKSFQTQVESNSFGDSTAAKLAEFMKSKRDEITYLIERAERLASQLQSKPLELVLCHTDIHGGNILISDNDELYIVDWDNPLFAPKERDLMFIGGGIDEIWNNGREKAMFYEGYGKTEINLAALAYYRYERIVQDLSVIGGQLLMTDEGGADREQAYEWFISNFEPGRTIEIAQKTDKLLS